MHLIKRLHKKKEKKFIPTKYHVKKWFDIINMYIFNFQLTPFDKVKIKNMGNAGRNGGEGEEVVASAERVEEAAERLGVDCGL